MPEPIERLSLGRYHGVIDYPEGYRLGELEVLVDRDVAVGVDQHRVVETEPVERALREKLGDQADRKNRGRSGRNG